MPAEQHQPQEIVIIRRRGESDLDEPKTGVWKIAYADFMTAMMAFFLVMWLINATDEETREVVAAYFNPIRLAEATSDRRGLRDPEASSQGVDLPERSDAPVVEGEEQTQAPAPRLDAPRRYSETALFQDPYAVLAELSAQARFEPTTPAAAIDVRPGEAGPPGLVGGEAYRDPFDPIYWQLAPLPSVGRSDGDGTGGPMGFPDAASPFGFADAPKGDGPATSVRALVVPPTAPEPGAPLAAGEAGAAAAAAAVDAPTPEGTEEPPEAPAPTALAAAPAAASPPADAAAADAAVAEAPASEAPAVVAQAPPPTPEPSAQASVPPPPAAPPAPAEATPPPPAEAAPDPALARALALRERIAEAMAQATGSQRPANAPSIEVAATPEGLLVSLTDDADFGMFAIGSAEPRPELVRVIEEIAPILAQEEGDVVVRGHTDGRPFRSADYDNWRLSTARAHMAYYMLVRGGLAEARILRVEGWADRLLKVADDPFADRNRRIEILIRGDRT